MSAFLSFYDPATGLFTGQAYSGDSGVINTPPGMAAIVGLYDYLSQKVDLGTMQVVDYQPPAPPDTVNQTWSWDVATKRWIAAPTLAALKAAQWTVIVAARDATNAGGFVWDGSTFDSDAAAQTRIIGAVQMAQLVGTSFSIDWTLQDNTVRTLSQSDMTAVGLAMGTFMQAVFGKGRTLSAALDAATTPDAVAAITWSYP